MVWTKVGNVRGPIGPTGPRGFPGLNGVPADTAMAEYTLAPESATYGALESQRRLLPKYIAALDTHPGEFNHDLALYNGSAADLANAMLNTATAQSGNTSAHLLFLGDSKTAGNGAGGFNTNLTSRVRDFLGASDGFAFAGHARAPLPDPRWVVSSNLAYGSGRLYLEAGSGSGAFSAKFTAVRASNGLRFVWFTQSPVASVMVSINGATPVPLVQDGVLLPLGASTGYYYTDFKDLPLGTHSIEVTGTVGSGGAFRPLGVMHLFSGPRLTVTNAGLSGSSVASWAPNVDRFGLYSSVMGPVSAWFGRTTAIVQLGTNTVANQETDFPVLIAALRGLGFRIVLVAPGGAASNTDRLSFKRSLYDLADAMDLPLVDFTALIGATGSAAGGPSARYVVDNLHENQRGYDYEAMTVSRVLAGAGGGGGGVADTGWIPITLNAGFSGSPAYRVISGVVYLRGSVTRDAGNFGGTAVDIFTLPIAAWVGSYSRFTVSAQSAVADLTITGAGVVSVRQFGTVNGTVYLQGVIYPVG